VRDKSAAIVEVNCETDFVARNVMFYTFVQQITNAFLHHGAASQHKKIVLNSSEFSSLKVEGHPAEGAGACSVKDLTALEIGNIGENILVRRGVYMKCGCDGREMLASYVHATGPPLQHSGQRGANQPNFSTGKYASLVLYETTPEASQLHEAGDNNGPSLAELGRQLCQHVVGMNPQSVGVYEPVPVVNKEVSTPESGANSEAPTEGSEANTEAPSEDESRLVYQEYMFDTTQTVGAVLLQQGLRVVDFVRIECGAEDQVQCSESSAEEQRAEKSAENAATN